MMIPLLRCVAWKARSHATRVSDSCGGDLGDRSGCLRVRYAGACCGKNLAGTVQVLGRHYD